MSKRNEILSKSAPYFPEMINNADMEYYMMTDSQMAYQTSLSYHNRKSWSLRPPEESAKFALAWVIQQVPTLLTDFMAVWVV